MLAVDVDKLYMPGEKEALEGDTIKRYKMYQSILFLFFFSSDTHAYVTGVYDDSICLSALRYPERKFEANAANIHFRTAESQFHRLLTPGTMHCPSQLYMQ